MSDLQNPLFDDEKEFLERKKLEYERALLGDVEHIKDQSVKVGKVALAGAGLLGGIWLISKAFKGKKRKANRYVDNGEDYDFAAGHDEPDQDDESGPGYYTAGNGKRYKSKVSYKSAADSAQVFVENQSETHEADDLGFGSTAFAEPSDYPSAEEISSQSETSSYTTDTEDFEDDPFQDLPYDDSRRLPASHAFEEEHTAFAKPSKSRSHLIGSVLQAFLQSDTGKVLVGQVAAVALALVTKKVSEFFPATKNDDLAASPASAPAEPGYATVASPASPDSLDASIPSQSL